MTFIIIIHANGSDKEAFFAIVSVQNRPMELFQMAKGLLYAGPQKDNADHTVVHYEEFAQHCRQSC